MANSVSQEKNKKTQCTHCWISLSEPNVLRFKEKDFCSLTCLLNYYRCLLRIFFSQRGKKLEIFMLKKKGWSTGILAGLILSIFLIGFFTFILLTPFFGTHYHPPIIEANINLPLLMPSGLIQQVNVPLNEANRSDPYMDNRIMEEAQERIIKERVKINLVKEYPLGSQQIVGVYGQAFEGSICALYLNNKLFDATTCLNGMFYFPRVTVSPGNNLIEVVAQDFKGRTIPSNTVEIFVDLNRQISERGRNITRGSLQHKKVCLTFDGGASASCAPDILQTLEEYTIQCTFFLTGDFIRNHPNLVKKMVSDGHEIANHTDTHPHLAKLNSQMRFATLPWVDRAFIHDQLKTTEAAFFRLTGKRMIPYWRAPYGEHNLEILRWAEEIGYVHISWTCGRILEEGLDTLDWVYNPESPQYFSAEEIKEKIIHYGENTPEGANGGIILMHLASGRVLGDRIHLKLPSIIDGLQKRGYHLARVSETIVPQQEHAVKKAEKKNNLRQSKELNPKELNPKGDQKQLNQWKRRRGVGSQE